MRGLDVRRRNECILKRVDEIRRCRLNRQIGILTAFCIVDTAALMTVIGQNASLDTEQMANGYSSMLLQGNTDPDAIIAVTAFFAGALGTAVILRIRLLQQRRRRL
ncbi:MAG: hypothetical protein ACI4LC_02560 [Emergencia sp.]